MNTNSRQWAANLQSFLVCYLLFIYFICLWRISSLTQAVSSVFAGFIAFYTYPELAKRVKVFCALGPVTACTHATSPLVKLTNLPAPLLRVGHFFLLNGPMPDQPSQGSLSLRPSVPKQVTCWHCAWNELNALEKTVPKLCGENSQDTELVAAAPSEAGDFVKLSPVLGLLLFN